MGQGFCRDSITRIGNFNQISLPRNGKMDYILLPWDRDFGQISDCHAVENLSRYLIVLQWIIWLGIIVVNGHRVLTTICCCGWDIDKISLTVGVITVQCHFRLNELMRVISSFVLFYPILSKNSSFKEITVCVLVWSDRQVSQYISFEWHNDALFC